MQLELRDLGDKKGGWGVQNSHILCLVSLCHYVGWVSPCVSCIRSIPDTVQELQTWRTLKVGQVHVERQWQCCVGQVHSFLS